jgi:PIN domain nuclease of toxin-antitoxin system
MMKLLLDTHALLWSIGNSDKLSLKAAREIQNTNNDILISAVSLWEIAIKCGIGKLVIDSFDIQKIPVYCEKMGFVLIPLEPVTALCSTRLPQKNGHKDPFDRMLIYQCIQNGYTLVSGDSRTTLYTEDGLQYIW